VEILTNKTSQELAQSVIAETAKARNEIACAQRDCAKAESRLKFLIAVANELAKRPGDPK